MRRFLLAAACLLSVVAGRLTAQRAGSVEVAAVSLWHTKTVPIDGLRAFGGGLRLGVWLPHGFAVESHVDLTIPRNSLQPFARYSLLHYGGSLLYNIPFPGGQSVFLRAGYGKLTTSGECRVYGHACPTFGAASGGLGFRLPMSGMLQVRGEAMIRTRPVYDYTSFGANLGFAIVTGAMRDPAALADDDQDGVANHRDRCASSPVGALVDRRGCPTDTDGDGVFDGLDRCPRTAPGNAVTSFGCPRPEEPPAPPADRRR